MRKIRKAISILAVFVMIGSNVCYPETLRVPINTKYDGIKSLMGYDDLEQNPYLDAFIDRLSSPDVNVRASAADFYTYVLASLLNPEGNIPARDYLIAKFEQILKEIKESEQPLVYGGDPTHLVTGVLENLKHKIGTRSADHSYYILGLIAEVFVDTGSVKQAFTFKDKVEAIVECGLTDVLMQLRKALVNKLRDASVEPITVNRLREALKVVEEKSQPVLNETDQLKMQAELSMLLQDWTRFDEIVKQLKNRDDVEVIIVAGPEMRNEKVNIDLPLSLEVRNDVEKHRYIYDLVGEYSVLERRFLWDTLDNIYDHVKSGIALVIRQTRVLETGGTYSVISVIDNGLGLPSIETALKPGESPGKTKQLKSGIGLLNVIGATDFLAIHIPGSSQTQGTAWKSTNKKSSGTNVIGYFFINLTDSVEDARAIENKVVEEANQYVKNLDEFSKSSMTSNFPPKDVLIGL